ncbi:hypothetical protein [Salinimicrobium sp. GXAS 041]|uniref:hypothetical protein n=1 Tax=Salinimicrobium sp. GXAS 041 TaxID=3400806 RepID=UPI003C741941
MNLLKNLFSFYINSSIHVALAVTSLTAISALHFHFSPDPDLLFFVFFGTVTAYNFIKFAGIAKLHHRSLTPNLKIIQVFSFFSFIALVYFGFHVKPEILFISGGFGILTLFYALPFYGERNLRTIGGIKIYIIAIIWAGVTVFSPVRNVGMEVTGDVFLEFVQRVLLVLVLLIPFEIRDLKYDKVALKTLPQNIGVRRSKKLGVALLIIIIVLEFLKSSMTTTSLAALILMSILAGWFVMISKEDQSRYFSSFWVEGIPIVWLVILLLLKNVL